MSDILDSVRLARRCGGRSAVLWRALGTLHELYVRPNLPDSPGSLARLNGLLVPADDPKWLDRYIGIPNYEWKLICGMRRVVEPAGTVTIVGGGYGVASVYASRYVGDEGTVHTYEGAANMVKGIRTTCEMHGAENVDITHGIVATANALRGESDGAAHIDPADLLPSDVLVLDCEGAEREIIPDITYEPEGIVVETHGLYGAPPELIRDLLNVAGYTITFDESVNREVGISILVGQAHPDC